MLTFYIVSVIISLIVGFVTIISITIDISNQIKLGRYTVKEQSENVLKVIRGFLIYFIPIANLSIALVYIVFYDTVKEVITKKLISIGKLIVNEDFKEE